jgi:tetratricopeptide (TPR) repeat protein
LAKQEGIPVRKIFVLAAVGLVGAGLLMCGRFQGMGMSQLGPTSEADIRATAEKLRREGNFAEAYTEFRRLVLNPQTTPQLVPQDLDRASECLRRLGRDDELDKFLEEAVAAHPNNWRLLWGVAQEYWEGPHFGFIVAGEFYRGQRRGGGDYVNCFERDRVLALRLMHRAMPLAMADEKARPEVARFFLEMAAFLMGYRHHAESWRLQYLTDLEKLPDFEPGWFWRGEQPPAGAPVDETGQPIFYTVPSSWEASANDGQRWRWCLQQAAEFDAKLLPQVRLEFANFLQQQFDVHTLATFGWRGRWEEEEGPAETGTFALHTLEEDETICRLATGVKRLRLPEEFNFLRIYQQLAQEAPEHIRADAIRRLATSFENRRQYPKAASWWKKLLEGFPAPVQEEARQRIEQIEGNWGRFEPVLRQPAGKGAEIDFRFRNGREVELTAQEILLDKLLQDVRDLIRQGKQPQWDRLQVERVGWLLVHDKRREYLGRTVAQWTVRLEPRPNHFDRRITISTPLQQPGAYLLTARMKDGNTSHVVVWVVDTAIVYKPLDKNAWYFVADARSGQPIPKANVEFFGFRVRWLDRPGRPVVDFKQFAEFTDASGQIILGRDRLPEDYQWMVIARTKEGRLAFLGFQGVWMPEWEHAFYQEVKAFVMTDRPVYRPGQTVQFKCWIAQARYDLPDTSPFAGKNLPN